MACLSSCDDIESSLLRDSCLVTPVPMLDCLRRRTFDRGLSTVEADDPDTRDGVLVDCGTSSFGRRDEELWDDLDAIICELV